MHTIQLEFLEQPGYPERTILMDAILKIIQHEQPMKASQIAYRLTRKFGVKISTHDINVILYSNNGLRSVVRVRPTDHIVVMRTATKAKTHQRPIAKTVRPKIEPTLIGVPIQPLVQPNPQATGGIMREEKLDGRYFIRRAIGLGYAFLAFEVIKLLL